MSFRAFACLAIVMGAFQGFADDGVTAYFGASVSPSASNALTRAKTSASSARLETGRFRSAESGTIMRGLVASASSCRARKAQYSGVSGHVLFGSNAHPPQ